MQECPCKEDVHFIVDHFTLQYRLTLFLSISFLYQIDIDREKKAIKFVGHDRVNELHVYKAVKHV